MRTQGKFAYAIAHPSNLVTLASMPVASTATALQGAANIGAIFEVDVMLPVQHGNTVNYGSLQMFVSSRTVKLNNVLIGNVNFNVFRLGIYQTMKFPIPDGVRSALRGAAFSDLTFQFLLSSPGTVTGTYLFDNLRVHSVAVVTTANASTRPPAGYGGSVDLIAIGNTPVAQTFDAAPVQVPESFHLKLGSAGSTTVNLDLGYDGIQSFTCMYRPDTADTSGKSYIWTSCTGGFIPGDLVGASWARLTIVGGDNTMNLHAQLAENPVGDRTGAGIIAPMPTWWGDFDTCVPAPVAGRMFTISASCANQAAQANQIVTAYFNKVNSSNPPSDWIVTPVPEFARRHGDPGAGVSPQVNIRATAPGFARRHGEGSRHDNLLGPPPPSDPDSPFDQERHMNQGGDFDAYWRLNGDLSTNNFPGTDRSTTHFDATFGAHVVLFGEDADILKINTVIDTDTGQTTPSLIKPSSSGSVHLFLGPLEIPPGGFSADPTTGFSVNPAPVTQDFNLPPIPIWIFTINLGASASVGVSLNGGVAPSGFDVSLIPTASLGAHIEGEINLGIASGGVDARITLLEVDAPITAQAKWRLNTAPAVCAVTGNVSLNGQAVISSGGGEIDLVASFLFYDASFTLVKWGPLFSTSIPLFDVQLDAKVLPLPVSLCSVPLSVFITDPPAGATKLALFPVPLQGTATGNGGQLSCNELTWSVTAPDTLQGQGCNAVATFAQPASDVATRTIGLSATHTYTDQFNRTIVESNVTSESINVSPLPAGAYIQKLVFTGTGGTKLYSFSSSPTASISDLGAGVPVRLFGFISQGPAETCTNWTVTDTQAETTKPILANDASTPFSAADWTPDHIPGNYTVTMTTAAGACGQGGATFGANTVTLTLFFLR
jgi:hypothetical protein